jgi:hypothetical protein
MIINVVSSQKTISLGAATVCIRSNWLLVTQPLQIYGRYLYYKTGFMPIVT